MKLRLLDLFCGAGGAAVGYARAGFEVVGVDLSPQPRYPFRFIQADAVEFLRGNGGYFSAAHASPPCQRYSAMSACRPGLSDGYPDLVAVTRDELDMAYMPYVIENVPGSPLRPDLTLCGHMFGLELYRHRVFEVSGFTATQPAHVPHTLPASRAGHWTPGTVMSISGHVSPMWKAREVMGIDWMNRDELAEAIPPAYTEHVGAGLLAAFDAADSRLVS